MAFKRVKTALLLCFLSATLGSGQQLSSKWEELTASDFVKALQFSSGVCLLPFGIIEKHGPSGPLGTDLVNVRAATLQAVQQQYAIVFPEYYFGQISEARHQPGTVAYIAPSWTAWRPQSADREWPRRQHRAPAVFCPITAGL